jgi:hypothetical protein
MQPIQPLRAISLPASQRVFIRDSGAAKRRWSKGMVIGRGLGWLLVLAALVVLARDLIGWLDTHHLAFVAAGALWYQLSPNTILLAQPAIQRHLAPWLWDPVIEDVLRLPAVVVLGAPGAALLWLCRPRDRRRRRH